MWSEELASSPYGLFSLAAERSQLFAFSVDAPHQVFQDKVGHIATQECAIFAGGSEVNASKYAGIGDLVHRRGKTRIEPNPTRRRWRLAG